MSRLIGYVSDEMDIALAGATLLIGFRLDGRHLLREGDPFDRDESVAERDDVGISHCVSSVPVWRVR